MPRLLVVANRDPCQQGMRIMRGVVESKNGQLTDACEESSACIISKHGSDVVNKFIWNTRVKRKI
jgi:NifU-like protein involved in Fe-S cluster formation